jgi:uncharacterized protein YbbK (DUF523 family)/uncharacterized protein YbgA (DUF1722 family)
MTSLRVGISACLLGNQVRWDGGHKREGFVTDELSRIAELVPVCPEVELGLGVPREPIHLVAADRLRLVGRDSGRDHTDAMLEYGQRRALELQALDLDGYVWKKNSPSCGLAGVAIARESGVTLDGRGMFAGIVSDLLPSLPMVEESGLADREMGESFVERLFAERRLRHLFSSQWTRGDLVAFHTREKMLLLSRDRARYDELGRLVARVADLPPEELAASYQKLFREALTKTARARNHVDVLQHLAGHLKRILDEDARKKLGALIDGFARGEVPLAEARALLLAHASAHQVDYLLGQEYLAPHNHLR